MYWLWKWLESYNNCTFSTWKDKFVFSLSIWTPNSFCTFHDYGRRRTPFLTSPDGPSLIFLSFRFLNNFLALKNRVALKLFTVLKYFLSFRTFEQLALALKTEFVMKFFTVFNILFTFRMFEQLLLALKNRVCPEFTVVNMYFLSFRILNNLRLPWKTELALKMFTVLNIVSH